MESDREALVKAAAARIRKRTAEKEERAAARRIRPRQFARDLAVRLGEADHRVERIIGFGSTFETWRNYRLDSDIDLAVIGGNWFTLTEAIEQLRAELRQDFMFIQSNYDKNTEMTARVELNESEDEFQYAALGYTLHNLYNAFESYFYRVAKFFENELGESDWHRTLVERMTLDISGIRPAVIDLQFSRRVDELRRFRHLFRNLYKTPLIPAKVQFANEAARGITEAFQPRHEQFDSFLRGLKHELEFGDSH